MTAIQPVILSGGSGTRLWPASRALYPKQLLPLTGSETMLQQTALRLRGRGSAAAETIVVCNDAHRFLVAEQLGQIDQPARIVLEPEGRNTAPAVALAALVALQNAADGDPPLLLVMPADHVIRNPDAFVKAVALGEAPAREGQLVTFGIVPTGPNTGYGYIEADSDGQGVTGIESFVEKPDLATAEKLVRTGRHYWNSGIFLFRADAYLEELEQFAPEMLAACRKSVEQGDMASEYLRPDGDAFRASPSDSIDYAVMEKTQRAAMVPLDAGWSDVGSWAALHEVSEQDGDGNTLTGDVVAHGCSSSYIRASHRLVATVGLDNVVVVEDADSVLVMAKDHSQDIKAVVNELKDRERPEIKRHRRAAEPWGSEEGLESDDGFRVNRLVINPGHEISEEQDARQSRHWVVVGGTATISLGDEEVECTKSEHLAVPAGTAFRISNRTDEPVHIIEVRCGEPV